MDGTAIDDSPIENPYAVTTVETLSSHSPVVVCGVVRGCARGSFAGSHSPHVGSQSPHMVSSAARTEMSNPNPVFPFIFDGDPSSSYNVKLTSSSSMACIGTPSLTPPLPSTSLLSLGSIPNPSSSSSPPPLVRTFLLTPSPPLLTSCLSH